MVVVLDYGMGNAGSIVNMVRKAGGKAIATTEPETVKEASAIVLPGVGAFDNGMKRLRDAGLVEVLEQKVLEERIPFLGVCLGMQLLFERSEEGTEPGLGWIKGEVKRFDFSGVADRARLKVPLMGWNLVEPRKYSSLFSGLEGQEARFYFVHSYHGVCSDDNDILARSHYGYDYTCAVQRGNIFGAQFHAEKSHRFGLILFRNFLRLSAC